MGSVPQSLKCHNVYYRPKEVKGDVEKGLPNTRPAYTHYFTPMLPLRDPGEVVSRTRFVFLNGQSVSFSFRRHAHP